MASLVQIVLDASYLYFRLTFYQKERTVFSLLPSLFFQSLGNDARDVVAVANRVQSRIDCLKEKTKNQIKMK